MRRLEKEIKDRSEIDSVIRNTRVCRLGMVDGAEPYVVPMCFGYDGAAFYFHCAKEGRKLDILRKNNKVCFELDVVVAMVEHEQACRWGVKYQSVLGLGTVSFIEVPGEKRTALSLIMSQYSPVPFTFPDEAVSRIVVFKVKIESISGKKS